jgi:hypothetical protein
MIDLIRLNTPSTAIPNNLKGTISNHTMGYKTKASSASGQQNINSNIQAMNVIICLKISTVETQNGSNT